MVLEQARIELTSEWRRRRPSTLFFGRSSTSTHRSPAISRRNRAAIPTRHTGNVSRENGGLYRWQFDVYYSDCVEKEARRGDPSAANKRMKALAHFEELKISSPAKQLAARILERCHLPLNAELDTQHAAIAAMHSMQFLLTWNCRHLANKHIRPKLMYICRSEGYTAPLILTPDEAIRLRTHAIPDC